MQGNEESLEDKRDFKGKCTFCKLLLNPKKLKYELDVSQNEEPLLCDRWIYEDDLTLAILAPEQYTKGHSLVMLRRHREDICDPRLTIEEMDALMGSIHCLSQRLMMKLDSPKPERIYVASLCDGVEHLHFHLIPRYSIEEGGARRFFEESHKSLDTTCTGVKYGHGFWYLGYKETAYHCLESKMGKVNHRILQRDSIEELARKLR
jgi:histidine triad (HIT) family protein